MAMGWRLLVQRGRRIEHYVVRAADEAGAIAALHKRRGMAMAIVVASEAASDDELTAFSLREGEAQRVATPKE
jgi:hypothetical protein